MPVIYARICVDKTDDKARVLVRAVDSGGVSWHSIASNSGYETFTCRYYYCFIVERPCSCIVSRLQVGDRFMV